MVQIAEVEALLPRSATATPLMTLSGTKHGHSGKVRAGRLDPPAANHTRMTVKPAWKVHMPKRCHSEVQDDKLLLQEK